MEDTSLYSSAYCTLDFYAIEFEIPDLMLICSLTLYLKASSKRVGSGSGGGRSTVSVETMIASAVQLR